MAAAAVYETEINALKETLQAQQELLQKLYIELDAERESSATAASESLSMILRLQEQKALVEMEASHYKRMAEEKMYYTEESLVAFEDLMYQKDMEITCLEFQVEAYKCKLLSVGCSADVSSHDGHVRRNNSLPPIPAAKGYNRSPSPMLNMTLLEERMNNGSNNGQQYLESEKSYDNAVVGNMDSYWEQIRKLDERVKERLDYCSKDHDKGSNHHRILNCRSRSSSLSSKVNYENEPIVITEIQDIFEVPQVDQERKSCGKRNLTLKRLVKPETVMQDMTLNTDKISFVRHTQPEMFKPSEGGHVGKCHMDGGAYYKAEIQQLTSRMERLESRVVLRQEISEQRDNELMLKEMREQLNLLQSEMRSWTGKIKNPSLSLSPPADDSSLIPVMEAMLHFWL